MICVSLNEPLLITAEFMLRLRPPGSQWWVFSSEKPSDYRIGKLEISTSSFKEKEGKGTEPIDEAL